jgi:hypothetical protein
MRELGEEGGGGEKKKQSLKLDIKKFKIKQNLIINRKYVQMFTFIFLYHMSYYFSILV